MDKFPKSEKIFNIIMLSIFILGFIAMFWKMAVSKDDPNRFQRVYTYSGNEIYVDTETDVMYFKSGNSMSIMTDENGKPLIWGQ